ncbi:ATP-grasp domain-containing protein [bacterium]|nr:ATP-grasp domain-containing protein [bacterium]
MLSKKNILVFPCGSEIGLEIYRSLEYSTHFRLVGGSSVDDHGRYVYKDYIGGIPNIENTNFIDAINKIVAERNIDCIIPAHDSVLLELSRQKSLGNISCEIMSSPYETCRIARSKSLTYKTLSGTVKTPQILKQEQIVDSDFPIFVKPDVGQGSKGALMVNDIEALKYQIMTDPTLLIMEYLPGKEYTVDCFTNRDGLLLFSEGRERVRIANGISVSSTTVEDKRFHELATAINKKLVFVGVWFFQVKESHGGDLVLLEVAPRIAGTMGLVRCKGVNLALLSLFNHFKQEVTIVENSYSITIDRALENRYKHNIKYGHVYIDLDDLIINKGKINTLLIMYIYQCINNDIAIHLITRHDGDLTATLKRFRIGSLFDEVIYVSTDKQKYEYIKHEDSIFIDDSYAERKIVQDKLSIPTFDAHMVEFLLDGN